MTIGTFPAVGLDEARTAHRAARWLVARDIHPLKHVETEIEREQAAAKARTENTFRAVAEDWMAATESNLAPGTVRHRKAMLENHVFPALGNRPVGEIVRKDLRDLLTKLDQVSPSRRSNAGATSGRFSNTPKTPNLWNRTRRHALVHW